MKKNTKQIEKFILQQYESKKNRSVERNVLYSGHSNCTVAIGLWILLHIFSIFSDTPISVWPSNIALIILIPLMVLFTIKNCKSDLEDFINKSDKDSKLNKKKGYFASMTTTTGVLIGGGLVSSLFANATDNANMVALAVFSIILILLFAYASCKKYYKVYLIRKYCPYLKNRCE